MARDYAELVKEYRKLAKTADQRLVRLEGYQYRDGFATSTKWAYSRAMKDIKKWSGEEAKRFNVKPPESIQELEAKITDIKNFLESPTSTMKGITSVYKKKADTINKRYGTNFSWEDLANYYMSGLAEKLDSKYGSKTTLRSIAEIQKLDADAVADIAENKITNRIVPDKIVDSTIRKILKDEGLDITKIVKAGKIIAKLI